MRKDQHECQQQIIEILERVSRSIPVIEGEYYTPPVSYMKMNILGKLSAPPNLPIFSGQEPVPSTEGSMALSSGRCFSYPYGRGCKINSDRIS